jgi:translation elongation factor EF-Tu-like GTPase
MLLAAVIGATGRGKTLLIQELANELGPMPALRDAVVPVWYRKQIADRRPIATHEDTMVYKFVFVDTPSRHYAFINTPGSEHFLRNFIAGLAVVYIFLMV